MEPTPVDAAMAEFEAAAERFQQALEQDLFRCLDGELGPLIERSHRLEAKLKSGTLGLVAEFDDRGVALAIGDVKTRAWVRHRLRENFGAAGTTVRMATACSAKGPHPEVGAALAAGNIGWDQTQVIVKTLNSLPTKATLEDREFAKRLLLEKARELTPMTYDRSARASRRRSTPTAPCRTRARDIGCVGSGCTVPAAYCIGHHLKYWTEHEGPTELENGALVCPRHHVDVHHHGWEVRLADDGHPEFIPPPWIDPDQRPRRNHHWRQQQDLLKPPEFPGRE